MGCGASSKSKYTVKPEQIDDAPSAAPQQIQQPQPQEEVDPSEEFIRGVLASQTEEDPLQGAEAEGPNENATLLQEIGHKVNFLKVKANDYFTELQTKVNDIEKENAHHFQGHYRHNGFAISDFDKAQALLAQVNDVDGSLDNHDFLQIKVGDPVEIVVRHTGGWAYCRKKDDDDSISAGWVCSTSVAEISKVIGDHDGGDTMLPAKVGDIVEVLERHYSGWVYCREWPQTGVPDLTAERAAGWVTDAFLEDNRSEAVLGTKWHRLVLEALHRVVECSGQLEDVLRQASTANFKSGEIMDWMGKCLEFTSWLDSELRQITQAVAQHDISTSSHGCYATVQWETNPGSKEELAVAAQDRVVIENAEHAGWIWCSLAEDRQTQGWVPRNILEVDASGDKVEEMKMKFEDLPSWIKEGTECQWLSKSNDRHYDVRIRKVDPEQRYVEIVFRIDDTCWKSVPFDHFAEPEDHWRLHPLDEKAKALLDALPTWVKLGQQCQWWSDSRNQCMGVKIAEVCVKRRMVFVTFDIDKKSQKCVPFKQLIDDPDSSFLQPDKKKHAWRKKKSKSGKVSGDNKENKGNEESEDKNARKDSFQKTQGEKMTSLFDQMVNDIGSMVPDAVEFQGENAEGVSFADRLKKIAVENPEVIDISSSEKNDDQEVVDISGPTKSDGKRAGPAKLDDDWPGGANGTNQFASQYTPAGFGGRQKTTLKDSKLDLEQVGNTESGSASKGLLSAPSPRPARASSKTGTAGGLALADRIAALAAETPTVESNEGGGEIYAGEGTVAADAIEAGELRSLDAGSAEAKDGPTQMPDKKKQVTASTADASSTWVTEEGYIASQPESLGAPPERKHADSQDPTGYTTPPKGAAALLKTGPSCELVDYTNSDVELMDSLGKEPAFYSPREEDLLKEMLDEVPRTPISPMTASSHTKGVSSLDGDLGAVVETFSAGWQPSGSKQITSSNKQGKGNAALKADTRPQKSVASNGKPMDARPQNDAPLQTQDVAQLTPEQQVDGPPELASYEEIHDSAVVVSRLKGKQPGNKQVADDSARVIQVAPAANNSNSSLTSLGPTETLKKPSNSTTVGPTDTLKKPTQSSRVQSHSPNSQAAGSGADISDLPPLGMTSGVAAEVAAMQVGGEDVSTMLNGTVTSEILEAALSTADPNKPHAPASKSGWDEKAEPRTRSKEQKNKQDKRNASNRPVVQQERKNTFHDEDEEINLHDESMLSIGDAAPRGSGQRQQDATEFLTPLQRALKILAPETWDSDGEAATGGGPPDIGAMRAAWPSLEQDFDHRVQAELERIDVDLDKAEEAEIAKVEQKQGDLREIFDAKAAAAQGKFKTDVAEKFRAKAWEIMDVRDRTKEVLASAKRSKARAHRRKMKCRKEVFQTALGPQHHELVAACFFPDAAAMADIPACDAVRDVSDTTWSVLRMVQVVALRPVRNIRKPEDNSLAWGGITGELPRQSARQDARLLHQACESAAASLSASIEALASKLSQENQNTPPPDKEAESAAKNDEGLTKEQKRDKAMFEGQQEFSFERKLTSKIEKQMKRGKAASMEAMERLERVLRRRWQRRYKKTRPETLQALAKLSRAVAEAEAELDAVWQGQQETAAQEAAELERERRYVHGQARLLLDAAQIIRDEKARMAKAYQAATPQQKQKLMEKSLKIIRRLHNEVRAMDVNSDLKQNHSVLQYSLRMLEARLNTECPTLSVTAVQEGKLEDFLGHGGTLDEVDRNFEEQLVGELAKLQAGHDETAKKKVARRAQALLKEIAVAHAPALPMAREAIDASSQARTLADFALAAVQPLAKVAEKLLPEVARHLEIQNGPGDATTFRPNHKRFHKAVQDTQEVLTVLQRLLSGCPPAIAVQWHDKEWEGAFSATEEQWRSFCDAHPPNEALPETPRDEADEVDEPLSPTSPPFSPALQQQEDLRAALMADDDLDLPAPKETGDRGLARPKPPKLTSKKTGGVNASPSRAVTPKAKASPPKKTSVETKREQMREMLGKLDALGQDMDNAMRKTANLTRQNSNPGLASAPSSFPAAGPTRGKPSGGPKQGW